MIRFHDHFNFVSTNNTNKIKVGGPGYPIFAVRIGKNVLLVNKNAAQLAYHNFSSLTTTPTVALMNDIPPKADDSWNLDQPYMRLKITATEP